MRKKSTLAIIALIALTSLAALGSAPGFVDKIIESVKDNTVTRIFSTSSSSTNSEVKEYNSEQVSFIADASDEEVPQKALWSVVFNFSRDIESEAEKLNQEGKDGTLYRNYFIRQGHLSVENNFILQDISKKYFDEIEPIDQMAEKISEEARAGYLKKQVDSKEQVDKNEGRPVQPPFITPGGTQVFLLNPEYALEKIDKNMVIISNA